MDEKVLKSHHSTETLTLINYWMYFSSLDDKAVSVTAWKYWMEISYGVYGKDALEVVTAVKSSK